MKIIAIIPARYESSRLPGKMLLDIDGKSMLHRVYLQAQNISDFENIIVATDHQCIVDHCLDNNMKVEMTDSKHISGTERIAEVAQKIDADIVINIQGDEPFIEVKAIKSLVSLMKKTTVQIGTLYKEIKDETSLFDINKVKLVKDNNDKILYFSRQAIPAHRDLPYREWFNTSDYFQHLGLYGFKKSTLLELVKLAPTALELSEKLEQLRWLENGFDIFGTKVESSSFGIDTQEDLLKARKHLK